MARPIRCLVMTGLLAGVAACASSHMLVGTPRPPIAPEQVRFYFGPPSVAYEEIALLDVRSGAFTYGEQNKTDAIQRRLREEAAKVGANGVIYGGSARGHGGGGVSVGGGGGSIGGRGYSSVGVGVNISPEQKYGRGTAIYVPNPPPETSQPQSAPPQQ